MLGNPLHEPFFAIGELRAAVAVHVLEVVELCTLSLGQIAGLLQGWDLLHLVSGKCKEDAEFIEGMRSKGIDPKVPKWKNVLLGREQIVGELVHPHQIDQ